jgi:hypothetical protein
MKIKLMMYLFLTVFVLPIFLFGCNTSQNDERKNNETPDATVPTMDTSVPTNTETATFALG